MSYYSFDAEETELASGSVADADTFIVHDNSAKIIKKVAADSIRDFAHSGIVNVTAATVTITQEAHGGRTVTLDRAGGIAVTLPAASGTGAVFNFIVETTFTSDGTIKVANASDSMVGYAIMGTDGTSIEIFGADSGDDTITLNGSTSGGLIGMRIRITDIAANLFHVDIWGETTGVEVTPFSATVS